ncbi:cupin domain-containing protein [Paludibacterium paludis]|uniref:Auxin-binding protein n=1 Tax=Paludibacterium paludis TaxID=1225769 RepID=A0A918P5W7_9NEIS|nr:cupin domain-containing protein [Paludibacterium paludis]GGY23294.1 auxin-binding protein [Paludibacterium paludis]
MSERARELVDKLIRNYRDANLEREVRDPLYETLCCRLGRGTAACKLGASVDTVPPGKRACPYHFHHAQEEMFVILSGEGTLRVAGEMLPVREDNVIFIPPGPEYPHQLINTSHTSMTYLSVSTQDSPEICEYPDSGKYFAAMSRADGSWFGAIQKTSASLDYWQDEP